MELKEGEVLLETALEWKDAFWVDARPRREYETEHVPGALLLNEDEWNALLPDFLDIWQEDRPIVVYCSSLSCEASHAVAERMRRELALPKVFVLKGGWEAWKSWQK